MSNKREIAKIAKEVKQIKAQLHRVLRASPRDSVERETSGVVKALKKLENGGFLTLRDPDFEEGILAYEWEEVQIDIIWTGSGWMVFVSDNNSCFRRLDGNQFATKQLYGVIRKELQSCMQSYF